MRDLSNLCSIFCVLLRNEELGEGILGVEGEHLRMLYAELALMSTTVGHFPHEAVDVVATSFEVEGAGSLGGDDIVEFVGKGARHETDAAEIEYHGVGIDADMLGKFGGLGSGEEIGAVDVVESDGLCHIFVLFLFEVINVTEALWGNDGDAQQDDGAGPVEESADVGVIVQPVALVAVEGTAGKHEEGTVKTFDEHTARGRDAIATVLGTGAVFGGASFVGQSQSLGGIAVNFLLEKAGLGITAGDGDAIVGDAEVDTTLALQILREEVAVGTAGVFVDIVNQFAEEVAQGRGDSSADASLAHDDIAHDGTESILVLIVHRKAAKRDIAAFSIMLHYVLGGFLRGIFEVEHAVEVDVVQVGLHFKRDVFAAYLFGRLLAVDGQRGEEEGMQETDAAEVPDDGVIVRPLSQVDHLYDVVETATDALVLAYVGDGYSLHIHIVFLGAKVIIFPQTCIVSYVKSAKSGRG